MIKYLTVSVWSLSAAMGGWLAYDYHVDVVDDRNSVAEYWLSEYEWAAKQRNVLIDQYHELEAELAGAHERNRNLDSENLLLYGYIDDLTPAPIVNPDPMDATVKVQLTKGGHGSGTHIGNGYIVTAGHVGDVAGEINTVRFEDGSEYKVETLWTRTQESYDVALLKIVGDFDELPGSNLSCRTPYRGEEIRLFGNPQSWEYTVTYGRVSGGVTSKGEWWQEVIPVDAASGPGSSGGGVFDGDGNLVGILVGTQYSYSGDSPISVGINIVVPGSTICNLMGRTE